MAITRIETWMNLSQEREPAEKEVWIPLSQRCSMKETHRSLRQKLSAVEGLIMALLQKKDKPENYGCDLIDYVL